MCICQMQNSCLITSNFLENMDSSTPTSETTENVCLFFLVHHLFPLEFVFRCNEKSNLEQKRINHVNMLQILTNEKGFSKAIN